jgi:hypothetical protein
LVGATIVIRSETVITAYCIVSNALQAENATARMLSLVVKALPQGASLDLIVETVAVYQTLGCCSDIASHGWDMNQYCQHQGWKEVMTAWKNQGINATVRKFEEEGTDAENGPFRPLAMKEAIQAVKDGMHDRDLREGGQ